VALADAALGHQPAPPAAALGPVAQARLDLTGLHPADAARLAEIVYTLARHGAVVAVRRGPAIVLRVRRRGPRALSVALRRSFVDLGPTFVKLGQLIASSPGLFPDVLASEFRSLLDAVPPMPAAQVHGTIERSLGRPARDIFATFDETPLAAASIAQVHRATLPDGTDVVVKVRRAGLGRRLTRDLRLMRYLAAVLGRTGTYGQIMNPTAIVEDFAETLGAELDFRNEARWMAEFHANLRSFGDNRHVTTPLPVVELCSERVLVMTFIDGHPVDDLEALAAGGHDFEEVLRLGVRAWLESAFEHGLFHGDVHAGNLFVTPASEVALLDFGIMGHLTPEVRAALRDALPGLLLADDPYPVVQAFFALGAVRGPVDLDRAAADVQELVAPLAAKPLSQISYGELLGNILRVAGRHGVRLPRELVLVVKQILYFERYAKELAPDYQILSDPRLLTYLLPQYEVPVERPTLTTRPRTRPLDGDPEAGLHVESVRDDRFSWEYDSKRPELAKLYAKAKDKQWNASVDIDWSIEVDREDPGGLSEYLPVMAADAFDAFTDAQKREAGHVFNTWLTSQFLHGEQGALLATSKLVAQVPDVDAKFYGATQVMDEARHVEVYGRYLNEKLGEIYPINPNLQQLLEIIVADPRWDVTYLGMQIIVEGLALAAFGLIHQFSTEPLIKQITRYVMADEARHVAFGALALSGYYDELTSAERLERQDFVLEASWLMRDRFLATEVWERLGIPPSDGLLDASRSPMMQMFQHVLFAKITPNLTKIGLMDEKLRDRLVAIGAIATS
jgi:predicted unusual protein kinase regulating ubiquinone biosynthesis (AarF/ABC1/UbiB family)